MLRSLTIRNLALVEELFWELPSGFVAVTGETGAGKSIILGALKFLIGERADRGLVRHGATAATIEAVFYFQNTKELDDFLEERGIDPCGEGELILKRSITIESSGRQFVNGSACNLALLKDLGKRLVDLHGPHDHQSLFSRSEQTFLLDSFSGALKERSFYLACRKEISSLLKEKEEMTAAIGNAALLEQLTSEIEEIHSAELDSEEEEALLARHRLATHGQRLRELSVLAVGRLNEEEISVASMLAETTKTVRELARLDTRAEEEFQELTLISEKVQQLARRFHDYNESIELDQNEQQQIEERLDLLAKLKRKYGATLAEVIAYGEEATRRLELLASSQERLSTLDSNIEEAQRKMFQAKNLLTEHRKKGAKKLTVAIVAALKDLGFRQAGFEIFLEKLEEASCDGGEQADFLFAPNPGEPLQPLRMIASSGEISRVMLALKSAMAWQDRVPLLVFDEIDANVGGEIASKVGAKMRELARDHQVLCITHLPQVAAAAASQVVVQKEVHEGRTSTRLIEVKGAIREEEIARMLGGSSDSAKAHARTLLKK
ncbi:MAG: DNA repair protein RecN [Chthoniobacterales bacterium]|nr:DNA repair protein RecN [Chthoniobacterales bacterium]